MNKVNEHLKYLVVNVNVAGSLILATKCSMIYILPHTSSDNNEITARPTYPLTYTPYPLLQKHTSCWENVPRLSLGMRLPQFHVLISGHGNWNAGVGILLECCTWANKCELNDSMLHPQFQCPVSHYAFSKRLKSSHHILACITSTIYTHICITSTINILICIVSTIHTCRMSTIYVLA